MNTIDIIICSILAFFLIKGLFRGLIIEVFTLAGLLVGHVVALKGFSTVTAWIDSAVKLPALLVTSISFLIIFLGILVLFRVTAGFVRKFAKWTLLSWVDRLCGGVFGIVKGSLIASLLALLFSLIPLSSEMEKTQEESLLFTPIRSVAPAIFNFVQKTFPKTKDFYAELKDGFSRSSKEVKDRVVEKQLENLQGKLKDHDTDNK
jgi:membrane protein required for colicin V production